MNKYEKLPWFYDFQKGAFFIQRIQVCGTKIGGPKKTAENLSDPKNSGNFVKPQKKAYEFANTKKIKFRQISKPKKQDEQPFLNFDMFFMVLKWHDMNFWLL